MLEKENEMIKKIIKKLKKQEFKLLEIQKSLKENIRPDIVAEKDDEIILIEVKTGTAPGIRDVLQVRKNQELLRADKSYIVSPLIPSGSTVTIANQEHINIVNSRKIEEMRF